MGDSLNQGDSAELEALFDSVAAQSAGPASDVQAPAPGPSNDSDDLQALFDSIVASSEGGGSVEAAPVRVDQGGAVTDADQTFTRIGQMARQLHDMLHDLGYDKLIEKTVEAIPDATDRLAYVATLTEQAALRVLNATDIAMPLQEQLAGSAKELSGRWERLYANDLSVDEFRQLADDTRGFLAGRLPESVESTNAQLMEIMMAQDFQDLTGQVIKKIVALTKDLERQMMTLLIEIMPDKRKTEAVSGLLNGPVVNPDGRKDIVTNQTQVDDLLDSLGF